MAKYVSIDPVKCPGVVYYESEIRKHNGKPDRCLYITYKTESRLVREKVGWLSEGYSAKLASQIRSERLRTIRHGHELPKERRKIPTFEELARAYLDHYKGFHGKADLIDLKRYELHLAPVLGEKKADQIDPLTIDRIRINLKKDGRVGSIYNVLELARRILNFAFKKRLIKTVPVKISMPQRNNERTECLTQDELTRLLQVLDSYPDIQISAIFKLALYSGMRRSELLRLEWRDVDFERRTIRLRETKGGIDQSIPMNDVTYELLRRHPRVEEGSPYVFPGKDGNKRYDIKRHADYIRRVAELPKGFRPMHGLRHTYASLLASSGKVDLYTLSKLLTHKSPATTKRYAHLADKTLQQATNVMNDIINLANTEKPALEAKK
ncbi:MAG: site-specific integrase [Thermodesulfobacteriota bacterium]|nr:site-specific integrase [Thermodesulfobacteriota bacterium]